MKSIRALWALHSRIIPANESKSGIASRKEAFYAGAAFVLSQQFADKTMSDEEYDAQLSKWFKELEEFTGRKK